MQAYDVKVPDGITMPSMRTSVLDEDLVVEFADHA